MLGAPRQQRNREGPTSLRDWPPVGAAPHVDGLQAAAAEPPDARRSCAASLPSQIEYCSRTRGERIAQFALNEAGCDPKSTPSAQAQCHIVSLNTRSAQRHVRPVRRNTRSGRERDACVRRKVGSAPKRDRFVFWETVSVQKRNGGVISRG